MVLHSLFSYFSFNGFYWFRSFAKALGCDDMASLKACVKTKQLKDILAAQLKVPAESNYPTFAPVIDGFVLPGNFYFTSRNTGSSLRMRFADKWTKLGNLFRLENLQQHVATFCCIECSSTQRGGKKLHNGLGFNAFGI